MPSILSNLRVKILKGNKRICTILICLSILGCSTIDTDQIEDVEFSYQSFIDVEDEFSLHNFNQIPFQSKEKINFPFLKGNLWIKIKVSNLSSESKDLVIQNNDRLNWSYLYYELDTITNQLYQNNKEDIYYKDNRSFNFSKPNFKLLIAPEESRTLVLFTKSEGKTIRATPSVVTLNHFVQIMNSDNTLNIFFYSVLFIILLINIFYWRTFKRKVYIFYIMYIVFTVLFYISFDGYMYGIGLPTYIVEHIIFALFKCMIICLLFFSALFLEIKTSAPKFYSFFKNYLIVVVLIIFIYQIFYCKTATGKIHIVEYSLGFGWVVLMISMILIAAINKRTAVKYYISAMFFIIIAVLIGILKVYFTSDISGKLFFKIATTIEFIIFTYSTAVILKRNSANIERYKQDKLILEGENTKLQSKIAEINNKSLSKTDVLSIFKLLESNITNEDAWNNFKNKFEDINPNFLLNLNKEHPNLTKSEIKLLILIKIGFTQREISNMLFIAESSVKKAKQRVRKKMSISIDLSLPKYLRNF